MRLLWSVGAGLSQAIHTNKRHLSFWWPSLAPGSRALPKRARQQIQVRQRRSWQCSQHAGRRSRLGRLTLATSCSSRRVIGYMGATLYASSSASPSRPAARARQRSPWQRQWQWRRAGRCSARKQRSCASGSGTWKTRSKNYSDDSLPSASSIRLRQKSTRARYSSTQVATARWCSQRRSAAKPCSRRPWLLSLTI